MDRSHSVKHLFIILTVIGVEARIVLMIDGDNKVSMGGQSEANPTV